MKNYKRREHFPTHSEDRNIQTPKPLKDITRKEVTDWYTF